MVDLIVFPASYFSVSRVDEALKEEYEAALATGLFDTVLFAYDKWIDSGEFEIKDAPDTVRNAVYRGWMMKPEKYRAFYERLLEKNIKLVTEPDQYEKMHVFPNIYEHLAEDTARMEIFPLHASIDVEG